MDYCVIVICFYQLYVLSFWWHPFTAEDPSNVVMYDIMLNFSKSAKWKKTNSSTSWMAVHFQKILIFVWSISLTLAHINKCCQNVFISNCISSVTLHWWKEVTVSFKNIKNVLVINFWTIVYRSVFCCQWKAEFGQICSEVPQGFVSGPCCFLSVHALRTCWVRCWFCSAIVLFVWSLWQHNELCSSF